ncbi:MAG: hypothetical protein CFK49_11335 [Armatimonadetes bacterium JP3_11]|nr:MAG: hypothetical protein CFK48_10010 [Armatimonadetes bacterium CP1_7O]OYT71301.1 MAG: hypothetical protein CFK49_11335 [Armatimonadetes bacterium JP3_11]RMH09070.1 MAG: hypothetical protein D6697_04485 [Armatimonadota bacterium]
MISPVDLWYCFEQGKLVETAEACLSGIRVATAGLPIAPEYDALYHITEYLQNRSEHEKPKRKRGG